MPASFEFVSPSTDTDCHCGRAASIVRHSSGKRFLVCCKENPEMAKIFPSPRRCWMKEPIADPLDLFSRTVFCSHGFHAIHLKTAAEEYGMIQTGGGDGLEAVLPGLLRSLSDAAMRGEFNCALCSGTREMTTQEEGKLACCTLCGNMKQAIDIAREQVAPTGDREVDGASWAEAYFTAIHTYVCDQCM